MNKKILLVLILLLPFSLFSYEISFNKNFSKEVNPDLLTMSVNVKVEDKSENIINQHIEEFNAYIKSNHFINKKNGNFTLSPKYRYFKNNQEFMGYVGVLRYQIESNSARKLNLFMNKLINIKNKLDSKKITLKLSNISWKTSDSLYEKSVDILRLDAITWIEKHAKSMQNALSKDCRILQININAVNNHNPLSYAQTRMIKSSGRVSDVAPISTNIKIKINPNFIMECK